MKRIQSKQIFIADPEGIEKVDEQKQCFGENQEKPTSEEKSATMRVGEQVPTGATFSKYHCESPSSTYFSIVALFDCWNSLHGLRPSDLTRFAFLQNDLVRPLGHEEASILLPHLRLLASSINPCSAPDSRGSLARC